LQEGSNEVIRALDKSDMDEAISEFVNDINVDLGYAADLSITAEGDKDYINEAELKKII
jgi:hypothetical protein